MKRSGAAREITRDDIEAKFREIQGGGRAGAEAARGTGRMLGIAAGAAAVGIAYLLGRRKGRKRRTVVEVRRI